MEKLYSTDEITEILKVHKKQVQNTVNSLEIIAKKKSVGSGAKCSVFSEAQLDVIRKCIEWGGKRNMGKTRFASLQAEVEKIQYGEKSEEHPLVTDKRCLKMSYWPNVIPKCFEGIDDE